MTNNKAEQAGTSTAIQAMAALQRAAVQARKIAIQTDTAIIILRDGKRVRVTAEELRTRECSERRL